MFAGLYGSDVFVRLPEPDRAQLIAEGASVFEHMPGRPMREYVKVPEAWRKEPQRERDWVPRSMQWVSQMPEKVPAKTAGKRAKRQ